MNKRKIFRSEFLKTKRSSVRRIALASPLCLALLASIQQGYFSLNLFNWFYVVFLPATFALISAAAVSIDNGKHALRAVRSLPIAQEKIWTAKLMVVIGYALCSCLLLGVAVIIIPGIFSLWGTDQIKSLNILAVFFGIVIMFLTTIWQVPLCFLLTQKFGLMFTVIINLSISFSGIFLALKPYWLYCPWAWVNRCMVLLIGVLPNGLPAENIKMVTSYDVVLAVILSLSLTIISGYASILLYAKIEAR